ncbi:MAG TPA: sulfotransferase [Allosphingosinicella sp.]|jgi:hypothetical protein|nr:sulfotransferase [Allosphingosinicella sp.]
MTLTARASPAADASEDALSPIFVVGAVRSGTTLMSSMLSAHPAIAIAPDLHYVYGWVQQGRRLDLSSGPDFDRFWNAFSRNSRFGYLGVDPAAVREHIEAHRHHSFRGVYISTLETYAANLGKRRWGEKTPLAESHLETLLAWFPDARAIYMIRDPRAVVSSLRKTPWGSEISVEDHARAWAAGVERATTWASDPRIAFVRYEKLVRDPVGEARRVCEFIGENYAPEMVHGRDALTASALRDRDGWEKEHISAALRPVHDASIGKWASELTPAEIETVESICGEAMREMDRLPIGS